MRRRPGFTLIELLIVVVIIGILAAIAIPKFKTTKGKANAASIKSDLHNVAVAQEAYMYEHHVYAASASALNFNSSQGVVIDVVSGGSNSGWSASATHPAAYPLTCALFMGGVATLAPASTEGVIHCE